MKRYLSLLFFLIFPAFLNCAADGSQLEAIKDQSRFYRNEGYKLQSLGDLNRALSYYQKAMELDPLYYEVYNDLGVLYEKMGDDQRALMMYLKVLDMNKDYLPVYTNLAFIYERLNEIEKASYYWTKRYEASVEGDYFREVARQHLLALGTYPKIHQEILEKKALKLSQELAHQREQARLKSIEEARLHFQVASSLFIQGNYVATMQELDILDTLEFDDDDIKTKAQSLYLKARAAQNKAKALAAATAAVNYIQAEDYSTAGEKLKEALTSIYRVTRQAR